MIERTEQDIMKNWKGDSSTPLVSICTITYNHEKYIAEALDSFLMQQTDFPFEIIVDDDCSNDQTALIIRKYKNLFPNIIKSKCRSLNVGMMKNFVENLQRAQGEYIALCEGDDYWVDENKLSYQINQMKTNNQCKISFHPAIELCDGENIGLIADHCEDKRVYGIKHVILKGGEFCPTASLIFQRCIFEKIKKILLSAPVADHYIQIVGASQKGVLFLNKAMSIYRTGHPESWISNMEKLDKFSVESYISNRESHTQKHIDTLKKIKGILNKKYWVYIDMKISDRLITLAILYLKLNHFHEFKESIIRSKEHYNNKKLSIKLLYLFKNFPNVLKVLLKIRSYIANKN